jgi:hypothetical protein
MSGSVIGPQQDYLCAREAALRRAGAAVPSAPLPAPLPADADANQVSARSP